MSVILEVQDAWRSYSLGEQTVHALRGVSLQVRAGEFVLILGPSGSGKSSLLHILGAMDRPTQGTARIGGKEMQALTAAQQTQLRLNRIGFVFQTFNVMPTLTALENVALPMLFAGVGQRERERKALGLLEQIGLADRAYHLPRQLSGGERQRVAIARALANDPTLILADEPTGNLDSGAGAAVMDLLDTLRQQGRTIVMVTHNPELVPFADRVVTMRDGRIAS